MTEFLGGTEASNFILPGEAVMPTNTKNLKLKNLMTMMMKNNVFLFLWVMVKPTLLYLHTRTTRFLLSPIDVT